MISERGPIGVRLRNGLVASAAVLTVSGCGVDSSSPLSDLPTAQAVIQKEFYGPAERIAELASQRRTRTTPAEFTDDGIPQLTQIADTKGSDGTLCKIEMTSTKQLGSKPSSRTVSRRLNPGRFSDLIIEAKKGHNLRVVIVDKTLADISSGGFSNTDSPLRSEASYDGGDTNAPLTRAAVEVYKQHTDELLNVCNVPSVNSVGK